MRLLAGQKKILEICREGRTAKEITERLGLSTGTVYNYLNNLQLMGLIAKVPSGRSAQFIATSNAPVVVVKAPEPVAIHERAPGVNVEFIEHSHNIFGECSNAV
jgi:Fe2+ or Zn2+ uptake regulation protein